MTTKKQKTTLEILPLDVSRCQAEKPNGNSFMTLGGVPGLERCTEPPAFVLVEKKPGKDGLQGAMTVCHGCFEVFKRQLGLSDTLVFSIQN